MFSKSKFEKQHIPVMKNGKLVLLIDLNWLQIYFFVKLFGFNICLGEANF